MVLFILIILGLIALWFLSSFTFHPIGKFLYRIGKDVYDEINKDETNKNKDEKETIK